MPGKRSRLKTNSEVRRVTAAALVLVFAGVLISVVVSFIVRCYSNTKVKESWQAYSQQNLPAHDVRLGSGANLVRYQDKDRSVRSPKGLTRSPFGFKDSDGDIIVPAKFASLAEGFAEGLAWAFNFDGQGMYITPKGDTAFVVEADGLSNFRNGRAKYRVVQADGFTRDGYIGMDGFIVIPHKYASGSDFVGRFAHVAEPTWVSEFAEFVVKQSGIGIDLCFLYKHRIIDRDGNVVDAKDLGNL